MLATILVLSYKINKRTVKAINLPAAFKQEMRNLFWILSIFFATYFLRFFSDYFMVPRLLTPDDLYECEIQQKEICGSFQLIIYYCWTTLIWDFLPIVILFWFHHKNFKAESI